MKNRYRLKSRRLGEYPKSVVDIVRFWGAPLIFSFFVGFFLVAPALWAIEKEGPNILTQWQGEKSGYKGKPPMILIRDQDDLNIFWKQHLSPREGVYPKNARDGTSFSGMTSKDGQGEFSEDMPSINFDRHMLFVFAPGTSRFDYFARKLLSFTKSGKGYVLSLQIDRRNTGGYERTPWVMGLLPKTPKEIPILVTRLGSWKHGEPPQVAVFAFTVWGGSPAFQPLLAHIPLPKREFAQLPKVDPNAELEPSPVSQVPQPKPDEAAVPDKTPGKPVATPAPTAAPKPVAPPPIKTPAKPMVLTQAPPVATSPTARADAGSAFDEAPAQPASAAKAKEAPEANSKSSKAESEKKDALTNPFNEEFNIEF